MKTPLLQSHWFRHFQKTDPLAAGQLAFLTTHEGIEVIEDIHLSILQKLTSSSLLKTGTQWLYKGIKVIPYLGQAALQPLASFVYKKPKPEPLSLTKERQQIVAVLNGIFGDRLVALHNPLATEMTLIRPVKELKTEKILFIHGLCMGDSGWPNATTKTLAASADADIWLLRYNTGLSIHENADQLVSLITKELKTNQKLTLVGHSMGGLVATLAVAKAFEHHLNVKDSIKNLITLGTPFKGAPLAKLGQWVEERLSANSITLPMTRLTKKRSLGIQELRQGIEDELPRSLSLNVYCVAGELNRETLNSGDSHLGDGLVTANSALALPFANDSLLVSNTGHLDLLKNHRVVAWLSEKLESVPRLG